MNKLIIIGNGFDLAHGLKTSYHDFIKYYLKSVFKLKEENNYFYQDILIEVDFKTNHRISDTFIKEERFLEWFDWFKDNVKFKSVFFLNIIQNLNYGWIDIENEYFSYLMSIKTNLEEVKQLNEEFSYIRKTLINYLNYIETQKVIIPDKRFVQLFTKDIESDEGICILNFNYTKTAQKYKDACQSDLIDTHWNANDQKGSLKIREKYVKLINIHGQLNNEKEEPIFGIGDEYHGEYLKMKESKYIEILLKYSKSFWYQRNNNYKDMINYISKVNILKPKINVEIYGHSCGLSDRTLLKNIFVNDNINEIKLFHYGGKEGYIKHSYDIGRHFDDPQMYRMRFVSYNPKNEIPEIVKNN